MRCVHVHNTIWSRCGTSHTHSNGIFVYCTSRATQLFQNHSYSKWRVCQKIGVKSVNMIRYQKFLYKCLPDICAYNFAAEVGDWKNFTVEFHHLKVENCNFRIFLVFPIPKWEGVKLESSCWCRYKASTHSSIEVIAMSPSVLSQIG